MTEVIKNQLKELRDKRSTSIPDGVAITRVLDYIDKIERHVFRCSKCGDCDEADRIIDDPDFSEQ